MRKSVDFILSVFSRVAIRDILLSAAGKTGKNIKAIPRK